MSSTAVNTDNIQCLEEESDVFAENQHLWVIRATGDSASVVNAPDLVPNKW